MAFYHRNKKQLTTSEVIMATQNTQRDLLAWPFQVSGCSTLENDLTGGGAVAVYREAKLRSHYLSFLFKPVTREIEISDNERIIDVGASWVFACSEHSSGKQPTRLIVVLLVFMKRISLNYLFSTTMPVAQVVWISPLESVSKLGTYCCGKEQSHSKAHGET